ncbi:MAG: DEAD/DEAH box helicase [Acidobacteriota bacterium]|nr:DEAD/DEAH box helicase [Acidobacteriota bacterium]
MSINPLQLTMDISDGYVRYLKSSFRLKDKRLRKSFYDQVKKFSYTNGPLIEATPPFKRGRSIGDLVEEGVLIKTIEDFIYDALPYLKDNPLYLHQEKAIRKILGKRNVVIASGTGSGKTESFIIPIYDHLLREYKERKLNLGVRALLIYPMNALANDQLRKLRSISRKIEEKSPGIPITFGRYVGDTKETRKEGEENFRFNNPGQEPVKGELLSREEMRQSPPNILITNYAMLEYLLLRPYDSFFFDGEYARNWKFLVLDEAHIYNGANGVEMAMLIRRLKDRVCEGKEGVLSCIATSATLMKEEEDFGRIAEFARNLFGEQFEWEAKDENKDIIKGERTAFRIDRGKCRIPLEFYSKIEEIIKNNPAELPGIKELSDICEKYNFPGYVVNEAARIAENNAKKFLYEIVSRDANIEELIEMLESGAVHLEKCVKALSRSDNLSEKDISLIVNMINIAIWAKKDDESLPILPARYHLFVRAPEGAFVSFFPESKIYLERKEINEGGYPVFDLATCRRCGQEYLVGEIVDNKLKHSVEYGEGKKKNRYFLLYDSGISTDQNEDEEVAVPEEMADKGKIWNLCSKCGAIWEENQRPLCSCNEKEKNDGKAAFLTLIEIIPKDDSLNVCHACGLRSVNIVRKFIFQQDAPTAVLATALFQHIKKKSPEGKKVLVFSDSRQDAAFFAPYFESTHKRLLYRRLIAEVAKDIDSEDAYTLEKLYNDLLRLAKEVNVLLPGADERKEIWGWILQEFCALDRRNCLEGIGLLTYLPILPKDWGPIDELFSPRWGLNREEAVCLYIILLNTLRFNKAITLPQGGPAHDDEVFERFHRNREYKFRLEGSNIKKGIYSWIPSENRTNSRLDFLKKLYLRINGQEDNSNKCKELLKMLWEDLGNRWIGRGIFSFSDPEKKEGILSQLDYRFWQAVAGYPTTRWFICDRCGMMSPLSLKGVCPTYNCRGKLSGLDPINDKEEVENNHYRFLYRELLPESVVVHEHTAQLDTDYAASIQQQFIEGRINILSCSTTFELGVDLGELEAIFLRNVPPEPSNYIQRSGRAGRRLSSAGFTLTFSQLRSHDLTYFREPEKMVNGKIIPPIIEICNEKIIRRHLHSVVMSRFFRENQNYFGCLNAFFCLEGEKETGLEKVIQFIESKPNDLKISLKRTIPKNMHDRFEIENWGWVEALVGKDGSLGIADAKVKEEYKHLKDYWHEKGEELKKIIDEGGNKTRETKLTYDRSWAKDRMETIKNRNLIDFLATNTVIPKYGFPVDVVELTPFSDLKEAKCIRLERDLRMAIAEFAPGSQVIANGYIWESAGLEVVKDRNWPIFWYALCPQCHQFQIKSGTIEETIPVMSCRNCNENIDKRLIKRFVTPIFGFVTAKEQPPKIPGESRPKREYTTRPYFFDYKEPLLKEIAVKKLKIQCQYSTAGELAVICKGKKGQGFYICFTCGAAFSSQPRDSHRTPMGMKCYSPAKGPIHLGHTFKTDVISLTLENYQNNYAINMNQDFWLSLLYAILEGSSQSLGIRRQDIDGTLYPLRGITSLVMFDTVPGGAGHVKRIIEDNNLYQVIESAWERVKKCTCGEETSCYGCLRGYQNQFCHEQLKRGIVERFLADNLG